MIKFYFQAGAALNSTDNKGVTPLMLAAKGNHIDLLKYLIGAGASVSYPLSLLLPACEMTITMLLIMSIYRAKSG